MDTPACLFENFMYDMPKPEVVQKTGAAPCPGYPNNRQMFCASKPVEFLGLSWQMMFSFNNDEKLQQVILVPEKEREASYEETVARLRENGWTPVFLEIDGDAFDWIDAKRQMDEEDGDKRFKEMEQKGISGGFLSLYFFPTDFLEKTLNNKKMTTWTQAVDAAQETFRLLCLSVDGKNIRLSFTCPLLSRKSALRYGQMIKRN